MHEVRDEICEGSKNGCFLSGFHCALFESTLQLLNLKSGSEIKLESQIISVSVLLLPGHNPTNSNKIEVSKQWSLLPSF